MNRIYLASPFFSDAQNERIAQVKAALDQNPTVSSVFEPAKHPYKAAWQPRMAKGLLHAGHFPNH